MAHPVHYLSIHLSYRFTPDRDLNIRFHIKNAILIVLVIANLMRLFDEGNKERENNERVVLTNPEKGNTSLESKTHRLIHPHI